jgi:hypothetical protein
MKARGGRSGVTAAESRVVEQTELERVERWRAEELERAGYDIDGASQLAVRLDVDLHVAVALLERGCAPELALEILL